MQNKEIKNTSSRYSVFITWVQKYKIWMLIGYKFNYKLDQCIEVIPKL